MGIHNEILTKLQTELIKKLITDIVDIDSGEKDDEGDPIMVTDPTKAGAVVIGDLQGNPDPDVARISVTLHENDPETVSGREFSANRELWDDLVEEIECGGVITWRRRFTVKARCLLVNSRESLMSARDIASTVRSRIEEVLLTIKFAGLESGPEYVSRGVFSDTVTGEMIQGGGPPDAYDFNMKIRFEVLTTRKVSL